MEHSRSSERNEDALSPPGPILTLRQAGLIFCLLMATAYGMYHFGFDSPFVYDSALFIAGNRHVMATGDFREILSIMPARPLFATSIFANFLLTDMDARYFRLFNTVILGATGLMFAVLATMIIEIGGVPGRDRHNERLLIGLFLGMLFTVHPLQNFAVLYVWQRSAIMACFFYFATTAAYLAVRSGRTSGFRFGYALVGVLYFLSLTSKETAVTVPVVLLISEALFFSRNMRQIFKRAVVIATMTVPPLIVYVFLTGKLHGEVSVHTQGILGRLHEHYAQSGLDPLGVVLTLPNTLLSYLVMIVAPVSGQLHFMQPRIVVQSPWNPPYTAAAYLVLSVIVALCVLLARKRPIMAFGMAFWIVTLLPESLLSKYLFLGHRGILPMAGILLVLGDVLTALLGLATPSRSSFARISAVVAGCVLIFSIMAWESVSQAKRWQPLELWGDAFARLPRYSGEMEKLPYLDVLLNYSAALIQNGNYEEAMKALGTPVDGHPGAVRGTQESAGLASAAVDALRLAEAIKNTRRQTQILINMGLALKRTGRMAEAKRMYEKALHINPGSALGWNNLGAAEEASGDLTAALEHYRKAYALDPHEASTNFNLATALLRMGNYEGAIRHYRMVPDLDPHFAKARANLAVALLRTGRRREAILTMESALHHIGRSAALHNLLGVAYAQQGNADKAMKNFQSALEIQPNYSDARKNLEMLKQEIERR